SISLYPAHFTKHNQHHCIIRVKSSVYYVFNSFKPYLSTTNHDYSSIHQPIFTHNTCTSFHCSYNTRPHLYMNEMCTLILKPMPPNYIRLCTIIHKPNFYSITTKVYTYHINISI
ncbi:hypothetical protein VIGAN_02181400, partial [Vigna angularis var. angularis]